MWVTYGSIPVLGSLRQEDCAFVTQVRVEGGDRHRVDHLQWVLRSRVLPKPLAAPALHSKALHIVPTYLLRVSPAKLLKLLPKAWVWVGDGPGGLDGFEYFPPA